METWWRMKFKNKSFPVSLLPVEKGIMLLLIWAFCALKIHKLYQLLCKLEMKPSPVRSPSSPSTLFKQLPENRKAQTTPVRYSGASMWDHFFVSVLFSPNSLLTRGSSPRYWSSGWPLYSNIWQGRLAFYPDVSHFYFTMKEFSQPSWSYALVFTQWLFLWLSSCASVHGWSGWQHII